ncbi:hypothetical protein VNO77_19719 [Canavalia gladiata]|uniref:Uncharacterized protein n=1 Tax=Canavalia gladiata TaxID=3824 RepID=A0AAN9LNB3_CANGL
MSLHQKVLEEKATEAGLKKVSDSSSWEKKVSYFLDVGINQTGEEGRHKPLVLERRKEISAHDGEVSLNTVVIRTIRLNQDCLLATIRFHALNCMIHDCETLSQQIVLPIRVNPIRPGIVEKHGFGNQSLSNYLDIPKSRSMHGNFMDGSGWLDLKPRCSICPLCSQKEKPKKVLLRRAWVGSFNPSMARSHGGLAGDSVTGMWSARDGEKGFYDKMNVWCRRDSNTGTWVNGLSVLEPKGCRGSELPEPVGTIACGYGPTSVLHGRGGYGEPPHEAVRIFPSTYKPPISIFSTQDQPYLDCSNIWEYFYFLRLNLVITPACSHTAHPSYSTIIRVRAKVDETQSRPMPLMRLAISKAVKA